MNEMAWHLARTHADRRALREVGRLQMASGAWAELAVTYRAALELGDWRVVTAVNRGSVCLPFRRLAEDGFREWLVSHGARWFDLYRTGDGGELRVSPEETEGLRRVLASVGSSWDDVVSAWRPDPKTPEVRLELAKLMALGKTPSVARDSAAGAAEADRHFRDHCRSTGRAVLKTFQDGAGGTSRRSSVYLVLDRDGIVKVFKREQVRSSEPHGRLYRPESELWDRCRGLPGLPRYFGSTETGDGRYIRMSVAGGQTLGEVMAGRRVLSVDVALHVIRRIAEIVSSLHERGVTHLDLRPANVKVDFERVKLLDLSDARLIGRDGSCGFALMSDPKFAAPELTTRFIAGPEADVFALGVMAHCLLTGQHPFTRAPMETGESGDGRELEIERYALSNALSEAEPGPRLGGQAAELLRRALSRDPEVRPTMRELAGGLSDRVSVAVPFAKRQAPDATKDGEVLFPARMGVPHRGHIDFISRLLDSGFRVVVSLQRSYTITARDPIPKWLVMKMVALSLRERGWDERRFRFVFTPFYDSRQEMLLHFAMMPGWSNIVAVATGNDGVRDLFPKLPVLDQRCLFGRESEAYDTRSWGERLRQAIVTDDRRTFGLYAARGVEQVLDYRALRRVYCEQSTESVRRVAVRLVDADGREVIGGRVFRYASPERSLLRHLIMAGRDAAFKDEFSRESVVTIDSRESSLVYRSRRVTGDEEVISYSLK